MSKAKFSVRLKQFSLWKLEEFVKTAVRALTKVGMFLCKAEKGTFKEKQIGLFAHCLVYYPYVRLLDFFSLVDDVEGHYDKISGSYVQNMVNKERKKWGSLHGEIQQNTYSDYSKHGMLERIRCIEEAGSFDNMLEVGAGELTTMCSLVQAMTIKQPELYAIDLSLNRLRHGRSYAEYLKTDIKIAKASAFSLPFPDNSFDLVYTSHCLEFMPKHMFRQAVNEICRVSRGHVFLFEPTYEYSSFLQKMKMRTYSYMRGLIPYLENKDDITIKRSSVMKNNYNIFNQTSCHYLIVTPNEGRNNIEYSCPKCQSALEFNNNSYYCFACHSGFPIFDNIPVLDTDYALMITQISNHEIN